MVLIASSVPRLGDLWNEQRTALGGGVGAMIQPDWEARNDGVIPIIDYIVGEMKRNARAIVGKMKG